MELEVMRTLIQDHPRGVVVRMIDGTAYRLPSPEYACFGPPKEIRKTKRAKADTRFILHERPGLATMRIVDAQQVAEVIPLRRSEGPWQTVGEANVVKQGDSEMDAKAIRAFFNEHPAGVEVRMIDGTVYKVPHRDYVWFTSAFGDPNAASNRLSTSFWLDDTEKGEIRLVNSMLIRELVALRKNDGSAMGPNHNGGPATTN